MDALGEVAAMLDGCPSEGRLVGAAVYVWAGRAGVVKELIKTARKERTAHGKGRKVTYSA